MKKSELIQLTQIIEQLVRKEIKKQLPGIIAETFQNMMGKPSQSIVEQNTEKEHINEAVEHKSSESLDDFKLSMRELFAGASPVTKQKLETGELPSPKPMRQYTKNPVINQILNETTPDLRARERMVGLAAYQGGYNPGIPSMASVGVGEMMPEAEIPAFARNMPSMPSKLPSIPISQPAVLQEGQESTHVPLSAIPEGISALDIAKAGVAPPAVTEALTNYDHMRKVLAQSKRRK